MKTTSAAVLSLAALQGVLAAPANTKTSYPEVIPGPGLPSLASLGLTSKMLYEMPVPKAAHSNLHARFTGECGPDEGAYTDVNDIIACYHYLNNLGTQQCSVPANEGVSQFCTAGQAQALGQGITGNSESSYCSDVALGLLWVINSCTRPDQTDAGFQAANGNGNLIVGGVNINY